MTGSLRPFGNEGFSSIEMDSILNLVPEVVSADVVRLEDFPPPIMGAFGAFEKDRNPFILESSLYHPRFGRFSILGSEPFLILKSFGNKVEITFKGKKFALRDNPFSVLENLLKKMEFKSTRREGPFIGGAVGYLGYELGHFIEKLPASAPPDLPFPDMYMAFYDRGVTFDGTLKKTFISAVAFKGDVESLDEKIRKMSEKLYGAPLWREMPFTDTSFGTLQSNFSRQEYLEAVRRTIEYIAAGDIFQANISQRFKTETDISDFELFRRLRTINPAPFSAFLKLDEGSVISSSPERFLKVTDGVVETRPIKGTRPRGKTPEEDRRLARELLSSEKDNAELAMIVDLERNDLGRVCSYGSVRVPVKRTLEEFPTVFHLVGTVTGKLHRGKTAVDLIKATFPGGSITGAPKIRSMEIINELEPTRRSVYTGALGYIGFDGGLDLNIVIRTFLKKDRMVTFQVGGGIVADSEPEAEYQETLDKAKALIESLKGIKKEFGVRI